MKSATKVKKFRAINKLLGSHIFCLFVKLDKIAINMYYEMIFGMLTMIYIYISNYFLLQHHINSQILFNSLEVYHITK